MSTKTFPCFTLIKIIMLLVVASCISGTETPVRRLIKDLPPDSETAVQYAGRILTLSEYRKIKENEAELFTRFLKQWYGLNFRIKTEKYFLFAYRSSEKNAVHFINYLNTFYEKIYSRFFKYELSSPVKIQIFENRYAFTRYTGLTDYGAYIPVSKTIISYADAGHGTIWHELIHSFMFENIQSDDFHSWFSEGFASFYEMAFLKNGEIDEGYSNWRMTYLHNEIRSGRFCGLYEFMTKKTISPESGYAISRFIFCYMWVNGIMDDFINAYMYELCGKYSGIELGKKAIEKMEQLTGKNIDEINKDFIRLALDTQPDQKLVRKRK